MSDTEKDPADTSGKPLVDEPTEPALDTEEEPRNEWEEAADPEEGSEDGTEAPSEQEPPD